MNLLSKIEVANFKCFGKKISLPLTQGTYLTGVNNSGKTSILEAIRFFFDTYIYTDESYLNKTLYSARRKDYNRSTISLEFNLNALTTRTAKSNLIASYGETLKITKHTSITDTTKKITTIYEIPGKNLFDDELPIELQKFLEGIKIIYIHPQEGKELLQKAQAKLRDRLLANWGRGSHQDLTKNLRKLEKNWNDLRVSAKSYLSTSLTASLQEIYPDSEATINLPKNIEDIIAISDIDFRGYAGAPEIQLTSQGSGAQSTILYLTHFILDSDRTLHRGEYHPVWLLEEPESFLHAELIIKLAQQLNSDLWLKNIQMIVSTHSPMILATSRGAGDKITWNLLENYQAKIKKNILDWSEGEIVTMGKIMGDPNFYTYFLAAKDKKLVFIEDNRSLTAEKYIQGGIQVTKGLEGTPEIKKYIDVLKENELIVENGAYFIIDGDIGKNSFSRYLTQNIGNDHGFNKYRISDKVYMVLLPDNLIIEDLFDEFENHLEECISALYDVDTWEPKSNCPQNLTQTYVAKVRGKQKPANMTEAKFTIKNTQDVKDAFWVKVERQNLKMNTAKMQALKNLIGV